MRHSRMLRALGPQPAPSQQGPQWRTDPIHPLAVAIAPLTVLAYRPSCFFEAGWNAPQRRQDTSAGPNNPLRLISDLHHLELHLAATLRVNENEFQCANSSGHRCVFALQAMPLMRRVEFPQRPTKRNALPEGPTSCVITKHEPLEVVDGRSMSWFTFRGRTSVRSGLPRRHTEGVIQP